MVIAWPSMTCPVVRSQIRNLIGGRGSQLRLWCITFIRDKFDLWWPSGRNSTVPRGRILPNVDWWPYSIARTVRGFNLRRTWCIDLAFRTRSSWLRLKGRCSYPTWPLGYKARSTSPSCWRDLNCSTISFPLSMWLMVIPTPTDSKCWPIRSRNFSLASL